FVSETLVFSADIKTYTDYYAFGMEMVGRNWSEGEAYRFGHNGQEKSKEVGEDNYTAEFWEYDSQVIRRFNTDPIVKEYESPYLAFGGNPIWFSDVNGDDASKITPWPIIPIIIGALTYITYSCSSKKQEDKKITNPQVKIRPKLETFDITLIESVIPVGKYVGYRDGLKPNEEPDCHKSVIKQIQAIGLNAGYVGWGSTEMFQMIDYTTHPDKSIENRGYAQGSSPTIEQRQKALKIIDETLQKRLPVIAGVNTFDYNNKTKKFDIEDKSKNNKNIDFISDHYMVIVGKGKDEKGIYYNFFENAVGNQKLGTDKKLNRLYITKDYTLEGMSSWGIVDVVGSRTTGNATKYQVTNITITKK
ncbi:MAG: hypothetical protein EAY69_05560, partial [Cytophagales bacterium]